MSELAPRLGASWNWVELHDRTVGGPLPVLVVVAGAVLQQLDEPPLGWLFQDHAEHGVTGDPHGFRGSSNLTGLVGSSRR